MEVVFTGANQVHIRGADGKMYRLVDRMDLDWKPKGGIELFPETLDDRLSVIEVEDNLADEKHWLEVTYR